LGESFKYIRKETTLLATTALLYAEAKMGELLKDVANPTASRAGRRQLPEGITHKQSHFAQKLYENRELIENNIKTLKPQ